MQTLPVIADGEIGSLIVTLQILALGHLNSKRWPSENLTVVLELSQLMSTTGKQQV